MTHYDADIRQLTDLAVSLRSRGLAAYRAHDDDEALRLLDAADDAWRLLNSLQAVEERKPA